MDPIQPFAPIDEELPVTQRHESAPTTLYTRVAHIPLIISVVSTPGLTPKKFSQTKHTAAKSYSSLAHLVASDRKLPLPTRRQVQM